jgi:hypothetical protein
LLEQGNVDAACRSLEEAEDLGPSVGTIGLLAACHERQGKLATALREYRQAERRAREAHDPRGEFASSRARALAPDVPELTIRVAFADPSVVVTRNGSTVPTQEVGHPVPIDPGDIAIAARRGDRVWRVQVHLEAGSRESVDVPPLAPAVLAAAPAKSPLPRAVTVHRSSGVGPWPWIALSTGVVAIGASATLYAMRANALSKLDQDCSSADVCPSSARDTYDRGRAYTTAGNVTLGVAVAAVVAGAVLLAVGAGRSKPPPTTALSFRRRP